MKKKNGHKYLVLDDIDENKKVSKKCEEVWDGIKKEIGTIDVGKKKNAYGKDFKTIRFESNDDFPLNKTLKLLLLTIILGVLLVKIVNFTHSYL